MRRVRKLKTKDEISALVQRSAEGDENMNSLRARDAAAAAPGGRRSMRAAREVVEHIRQSRKGAHLPAGYTLRRLIEEGRRS